MKKGQQGNTNLVGLVAGGAALSYGSFAMWLQSLRLNNYATGGILTVLGFALMWWLMSLVTQPKRNKQNEQTR